MGTELRYPNFNARTEKEQLEQMKSYLYQLVDQLQFALHNVGAASPSVVQQFNGNGNRPKESTEKQDAAVTFAEIKSLIIKSADIVDAYYQQISKRLEGLYVAESDFGTFAEKTRQDINMSSTYIEQLFSNTQVISTDVADIDTYLVNVKAHIKTGLLDEVNGVPVYGLEIGQQNEDGFNKYARFTSDRLSFYDQNDTEVAYISDYQLYINNVRIKGSLQEGGYKDFVDSAGGIITRWVGGDG